MVNTSLYAFCKTIGIHTLLKIGYEINYFFAQLFSKNRILIVVIMNP